MPLAVLLFLSSCATPVPPSGGPRDETPPAVAASTPADEAVDVDAAGESIRITFSEYVEPASFAQAFSLTPPFDGRLDFEWRGRTVEVQLPDALRDNTTYVLTLDTNLRDLHSVSLAAPITLAFATGPTINRGRLEGRVVERRTGAGVAGVDVYAYAAPDSTPPAPLPDRPDYRTQTDDQGRFRFNYLTEQPYYVVALRDLNRNRAVDALEAFAVPPRPVLFADSAGTEVAAPWVLTRRDTVPPEPQRVRPLSEQRFAVWFDEPVHLLPDAAAAWTLEDSAAGTPVAIEALYQLPGEPQQVYAATGVLAPQPHRVRPAAVADTAGNVVRPELLGFTPAAAADTLGLRFRRFLPDTLAPDEQGRYVLPPRTLPGVRFNQPVDSLRLAALVTAYDTTEQVLPFSAATTDGVTYRLQTVPPRRPGDRLRLDVDGAALAGPDTVYSRTFRHMPASQVGELSGVVARPDTAAPVVVTLYPAEPPTAAALRQTTAGDGGAFLFGQLPEGNYRLNAFVDLDGDGTWDGGRVSPYVPAEPLLWSNEPQRVRPRWETALPDTLDLGRSRTEAP